MDQMRMFSDSRARARRTDPETSHEAAESLSGLKLTEDQKAVLLSLKANGPSCDQDIFLNLTENSYRISPSGARTRRKELCRLGNVEFSGHFAKLRSGRRSRIWKVTES
jgi:hypothetical protein